MAFLLCPIADSPGGVHFIGDNNQDIRLAWSEGYATYFASSVRRRLGIASPGWTYYINSTGAPGAGDLDFSYDMEGPSRGAIGAASEISVEALLWDIVDGPGTPDGTPGVDVDPLADRTDEDVWEVMRNYLPQPAVVAVALEDFWDGWFRPGFSHGREAEMIATFEARHVEFRPDAAEDDDTPVQGPARTTVLAHVVLYCLHESLSATTSILQRVVFSTCTSGPFPER